MKPYDQATPGTAGSVEIITNDIARRIERLKRARGNLVGRRAPWHQDREPASMHWGVVARIAEARMELGKRTPNGSISIDRCRMEEDTRE